MKRHAIERNEKQNLNTAELLRGCEMLLPVCIQQLKTSGVHPKKGRQKVSQKNPPEKIYLTVQAKKLSKQTVTRKSAQQRQRITRKKSKPKQEAVGTHPEANNGNNQERRFITKSIFNL